MSTSGARSGARAPCLLVAVAMVLAGAGCGSRAPASDAALHAALAEVVAAGAPGALLFVRGPGVGPFALAAGDATLVPRVAMRADTAQHVGSLTKTFTAVLVLQLVDDGLLALDEPIAGRVPPGLVPGADRITVRQLLQHTSGLRDYFAIGTESGPGTVWQPLRDDPAFAYAPAELVALGVSAGPEFPPGERYSYSNTGYVVLGMILESATGKPVAQLYDERILAPLGLRDTLFPTRAGERLRGQAHCHSRFLEPAAAELRDLSDLDPSFAWVAGAMISTTADVARFYDALLLDGTLLSPASRREMQSSLVATGQADTFYGLGIIRTGHGASQLWWHNGSWPGCTATAGVLTEQGVTVVQLQNTGLADQDDALTAAIAAELTSAIAVAGASL
jgi:D-alanyl-D-alanine carboxypeptidase